MGRRRDGTSAAVQRLFREVTRLVDARKFAPEA